MGTRFLIIKSTQHFFSALGEDDQNYFGAKQCYAGNTSSLVFRYFA
jgi:hypothetical protein